LELLEVTDVKLFVRWSVSGLYILIELTGEISIWS